MRCHPGTGTHRKKLGGSALRDVKSHLISPKMQLNPSVSGTNLLQHFHYLIASGPMHGAIGMSVVIGLITAFHIRTFGHLSHRIHFTTE